MIDDKSKRGAQDRVKVSGSEAYEVEYFAQKHGITRDQAQALMKKHGSNRAQLDAEAQKLKTKSKAALL
jgi:hypothetical protein